MKLNRTLVVLAALLVPSMALAIGEVNGRIHGKIIEKESQAGVPGATVTASSPAMPGGARTVQSQEDGSFELNDLLPGKYLLEIQYEGLKPLRREYEVLIGQTTVADVLWSAELAETETTVVTQERPITRPDSAQTGRVLTAKDQARVASARQYQSILQQAPGVSGGGNPNVRGGNSLQNKFLVDGIDITDVVTQGFSANINFDSISAIEFVTGGFEAKYNTQGSIVNLITAQGSNEWTVDSSVYINNGALSATNQFGRNPFDSIRPFSTLIRPPTSSYQVNVNGGGPILKDKLWFNLSAQYSNTQASQPAGPPLNRQGPNRGFEGLLLRGKVNYAPSSKHRITLSMSADPTRINFADFSGALANTTDTIAARLQDQGGAFGTLIYEYFPTEQLTIRAQVGGQYNAITSGPQGALGSLPEADKARYVFNRPSHFNQDDGVTYFNETDISTDLRRSLSFDVSANYRFAWFGKHSAEAGVQTRFADRLYSFEVPGGRTYADSGGGAGEAGACDETTGNGCDTYTSSPSFRTRERGHTVGFYVQDKWKPIDRLQITPGLRIDYGGAWDTLQRRVHDFVGFGPRLAANWDITGDSKTVLYAHYGRSTEALSMLAAANASPGGVASTYAYAGVTDGWQFQNSSGGEAGVLVDHSKAKMPTTDEFAAGIRRALSAGAVAGIDVTHRVYSNQWEIVEQNFIFDPSGTRVVGFANGRPETVMLITTPDSNWVKYTGIDFTFEAHPNENIDVFASYTLGFRYGPGTDVLGQTVPGLAVNQFQNLRQQDFFYGFAPGDVRHNLKVAPSIAWKGFTFGAVMQFQSGAPLVRRYRVGDSLFNTLRSPGILRSPYGTEPGAPNDAEQIAEYRLPDTLTLDPRITFDFGTLFNLKQLKIIGIAEAFNVLNLAAPTSLQQNDNTAAAPAQFSQVLARQQPFRAQFGLRIVY